MLTEPHLLLPTAPFATETRAIVSCPEQSPTWSLARTCGTDLSRLCKVFEKQVWICVASLLVQFTCAPVTSRRVDSPAVRLLAQPREHRSQSLWTPSPCHIASYWRHC